AHVADDAPWAERRVGPERARRSYALRSLLDAGTTLAFGSDWTVATLDPLEGLAAAVTRRPRGAPPGASWMPEQRVTLEEALVAYTRGAAYAGFSDGRTGVLRPGALADLVVLSGDPFAGTPTGMEGALPGLRVEETWVEGERVHGP